MLKWFRGRKSTAITPTAATVTGTSLSTLFEPAPTLPELPELPPPPSPRREGRLIFALDATASRSGTWVEACRLQETMFEVTASLGELTSQLAFYRGREFQACPWVMSAAALAGQMRQVYCVAGSTQISRVLRHAIAETKMQRVGAVIFVGDAMEDQPQQLYPLAQELGCLETPLFMFQEGQVDVVAATFRQLAAFSGGAYLSFDLAGIERLKELLGAIAIYAVGGHEALVKASRANEGARLLLTHLRR